MARGIKSSDPYRDWKQVKRVRVSSLSGKKRLTKAEKISTIPMEEIGLLSGESGRKTLESYIKTLRTGYDRRVKALERRGMISHAQIQIEETWPRDGSGNILRKPVGDMTRNQLIAEFARYNKFFSDVTSTVQGIKRVNYEQDARIFGTDKKGRPLGSMTNDQRADFWSAYDEFEHQNKTADTKYGSETIQQYIATAMFDMGISKESIFNIDTTAKLDRFMEEVRKFREENEEVPTLEEVANVQSGRGMFR